MVDDDPIANLEYKDSTNIFSKMIMQSYLCENCLIRFKLCNHIVSQCENVGKFSLATITLIVGSAGCSQVISIINWFCFQIVNASFLCIFLIAFQLDYRNYHRMD